LKVLMLDAAEEAPLRTIAQFSDGRITWATLDALIEALNGSAVAAAGGGQPR
jgi:hypothetical protein